ncbi:hypothetical protein [Streptomyces griseorubiginosus]|uniref:hypothetical protein n=1 Tax=Streptomyces griseorubiginosus TaxID=67304 RepID=UPI002E80983A|nr:hypothetical protein [Streptomyces griseorubiginosus]WUB42166.1 hypothetical protein OHN19_02030 [Streptomyces griseorubiginosus]WUB50685.1 hypothetical protein OG942_02025 [Streptomyces griseorubiginosus]
MGANAANRFTTVDSVPAGDHHRVVITGAPFPEPSVRALHEAGFEVTAAPGDLDEEGVIKALEGAWGYVLGGGERLSAEAWDRLPDLSVACFLGTGYGSCMELPAYPSAVRFANTPHANAVAVAECSCTGTGRPGRNWRRCPARRSARSSACSTRPTW